MISTPVKRQNRRVLVIAGLTTIAIRAREASARRSMATAYNETLRDVPPLVATDSKLLMSDGETPRARSDIRPALLREYPTSSRPHWQKSIPPPRRATTRVERRP